MRSQVEHLPEGGAPWDTIEGPLMPCVIFFPDAVLLGRECQSDRFFGLEVAFRDCCHKDNGDATEGSIYEVGEVDI